MLASKGNGIDGPVRSDKFFGVAYSLWSLALLGATFALADNNRMADLNEDLAQQLADVSMTLWVFVGSAAALGVASGLLMAWPKWWTYGLCSMSSVLFLVASLSIVSGHSTWWVVLILPALVAGHFAKRFWQVAAFRRRA